MKTWMGALRARLVVCVVLGMAGACSPLRTDPYSPQVEAERDSAGSEAMSRRAAELIDSDPIEAERLLREALGRDLYNGAAHNNLGVVYLKRGELYSAASEFEWSRKLMPGLPDPRLNLALTLERAGRTAEALETYRTALEVYPGHIESMQALSRLQVRSGRVDEDTPSLLREVALRGSTAEWREWARRRLALAGSSGQLESR